MRITAEPFQRKEPLQLWEFPEKKLFTILSDACREIYFKENGKVYYFNFDNRSIEETMVASDTHVFTISEIVLRYQR